jgi:hypothetical protein
LGKDCEDGIEPKDSSSVLSSWVSEYPVTYDLFYFPFNIKFLINGVEQNNKTLWKDEIPMLLESSFSKNY